MCAITGIIKFDNSCDPHKTVKDMTDAVIHRGPDDSGFFVDENVAFGHRRLSVIDIDGGKQPMYNEERDVVVILNGEIYNYRELRADLEATGHVFSSESDTEVIVHLYETMGRQFVSLLNGMFSFALYDMRRKIVLLGRDRLGQKPLFYFQNGGTLVFASELAALKRHPDMPRDLDINAISDYLSLLYIPGAATVYHNVRRLSPGCTLEYQLSTGSVSVLSYWQMIYTFKCSELSIEEAASELRRRVENAVERRLVSDVPLGVFLSGGVDSSIITALTARKLGGLPCKAFSIGFADRKYDERNQAREFVSYLKNCKLNIEHFEKQVNPCDFELLRTLCSHFGEPYADASALPTALLSRFARERVTVALSGDGADELFGGYERYHAMRIFSRFSTAPAGLRRAGFGMLQKLLPDAGERTFSGRARRFFKLLSSNTPERAYFDLLDRAPQELKKKLFLAKAPGIYRHDSSEVFRRAFRTLSGKNEHELCSELDIVTYLPGDILPKVDITSMSCALEVRSPFLDREVAEFAARLPWEYKQYKRERKRILKEAFKDIVPAEMFDRPKRGFGVPVAAWLRGAWKEQAYETLFNGRLVADYADKNALLQIWKQHQSRKHDWSYLLWSLLILELFLSSES
ncbi:MAG: asparagine synthase (glutamine-hydrolyzing) [Lentisphaerae bacterium]|nr:asparagine synthase (glutamine-hydrolyzing) [Lentisphaerota bacterium]